MRGGDGNDEDEGEDEGEGSDMMTIHRNREGVRGENKERKKGDFSVYDIRTQLRFLPCVCMYVCVMYVVVCVSLAWLVDWFERFHSTRFNSIDSTQNRNSFPQLVGGRRSANRSLTTT